MCDDKRPASNTRECFRWAIDRRVVGVLFDALPAHRHDLSFGSKTLIFACGCGLTVSSNGSFWLEGPKEIGGAIDEQRERLAALERETRGVLAAAGAMPHD